MVSLFDHPEICDRIAFLSNFHTNSIFLSSLNKKLCVLEFLSWGEVPGGLRALIGMRKGGQGRKSAKFNTRSGL